MTAHNTHWSSTWEWAWLWQEVKDFCSCGPHRCATCAVCRSNRPAEQQSWMCVKYFDDAFHPAQHPRSTLRPAVTVVLLQLHCYTSVSSTTNTVISQCWVGPSIATKANRWAKTQELGRHSSYLVWCRAAGQRWVNSMQNVAFRSRF